MRRYLLKKIFGLIPVFFGITLISFFIIHLAPGKPTEIESSLNPKVTYEAKMRMEKLYGLDKPLHIQYVRWMVRFVRLDFGNSYLDSRPVSVKIVERLPVTLFLNCAALIIIFCVGIPIGVLSALKRDTLFDKLNTIGVFIGFSSPEFWLALLLMNLFCINLGWFPVSGLTSLDYEYMNIFGKILDVAKHLVLPVSIAAFGGFAGISRYMRSSMIGVLHKEFIVSARARGISERAVIYKHALKNALLPVITVLGLAVPGLIGGSVIFESIFAIPGMGRLFFESVMARDYPTIMGIVSIGAILTLAGNLIADIAYHFADPRIRISD